MEPQKPTQPTEGDTPETESGVDGSSMQPNAEAPKDAMSDVSSQESPAEAKPFVMDSDQSSQSADMPDRPEAGETFQPEVAANFEGVKGASVVEPDSTEPEASAPETSPLSSMPPMPDSSAALPAADGAAAASSESVAPAIVPDPLPMSKPKKHNKGLVFGLIAAAVVLLLSGGAAAAYQYIVNKPDNVLKRALANTLDADKTKTIKYSGLVSVKDSASGMKLEGTFEGGFNSETGAIDLTSKLDAVVTNLTLDVQSTDGKTYYFKLGGLSGLSDLLSASSALSGAESSALIAAYAPLIDSLNDQWVEVNQSIVSQFTGSSVKTDKLSDADRQKMVDAYKENSFLVIKEKLADQKIKSNDSYHYKLGIDKTKLKSFATALKNAKLDSVKVTDDQLKEFNKMVDAAKYDNYPLEVWIAKSNKMVSQVQLKASEEGTTMSFTFTIDSYNQSFKVEKPAGAKSLLDLMASFMGDFSGTYDLNSLEPQSGISL